MTALNIAAIACVRDEADIIESFVRHNLVYVDHLFVIDNLSKDGTGDILERLHQEGLPVAVGTSAHMDHVQENVLTNVIRSLPGMGFGFDFVVLLDADEFIDCPDRRTFERGLDLLEEGEFGVAAWKTYVPAAPETEAHLPADAPVTARMRLRREREPLQFHKAIVPAALIPDVIVGPGSHTAGSGNPEARLSRRVLPFSIAHFPVRSEAQIVAKTILGSYTIARKKARAKVEGTHWDEMAERVRSLDYQLSPELLRRLALDYANGPGTTPVDEVVSDPMPVHPGLQLRYTRPSPNGALRAFDHYIARLIENCDIKERSAAAS